MENVKINSSTEGWYWMCALRHRKNLWVSLLVILVILTSGCKKLVEVNAPVTSVNGDNVYTNDAQAASVLTGIYTKMAASSLLSLTGITSMSLFPGLSADELALYSGGNAQYSAYYTNSLGSNTYGFEFWNNVYPQIFVCNSAIEGLNKSTLLTPAVKQQLVGEAMFMRAFFYFYLVNLYGNLPLAITTDFQKNAQLSRASTVQVYQQIVSDLKGAQNALSPYYLKADAKATTTEKVRPTKWAATALLARVYLFTGIYDSAEAQATAVINSSLYGLDSLNMVFLKNGKEAIWQLQPVNTGLNTEDARVFIIPSTGPSGNYPVYLSSNLLNAFELNDSRKKNWVRNVTAGTVSYYFPYKYKVATIGAPVSEYSTVLRLAEQYLIRAEARAQRGNVSGAAADLNTIRARANLANVTDTTQTGLLDLVLHERQVELFTEWGHRWLDLKRAHKVDAILNLVNPQKGGQGWNSYFQLYPIPASDLQRDLNLVQNTGY